MAIPVAAYVAAAPRDTRTRAERTVTVAPSADRQAEAPAATEATIDGDGSITIPVAGIRVDQLHDNFNDARTGHVHGALDIMAPRGTPVVAAVDGTIHKLFTSGAGGLTIYEYDQAEQKIYYYAHLDSYAAGIGEGLRVTRGTVIGYVGTTGNAPPGSPHLHFAIMLMAPQKEWWKGTAIDPYPLLRDHGVTIAESR